MSVISSKKVACFDQYGSMGGGQVVLLGILDIFRSLSIDISLVIPRGGEFEKSAKGVFGETDRILGCPELLFKEKASLISILRMMAYTINIFRLNRKLASEIDFIYANGPRQFVGVALLSIFLRKPAIYHVHINFNRLERFVIGAISCLKHTKLIFVCSNSVLRTFELSQPMFINLGKFRVLENALSKKYEKTVFNDRFTGACATQRIIVLGTLCPDKGQDRIVDYAQTRDELEFFIVGKVAHGAEKWARSLKATASPNVQFYDAVSDPLDFIHLHNIQFNIVPSRWAEPFGLVAIEGMASSCITVVSKIGGLDDIAEASGAVYFQGDDSLCGVLDQLFDLTAEDKLTLARSQFRNTKETYAPAAYEAKLVSFLSRELRFI
jgi:glycosyltransferase involved in cell wall biosynthesis